MRIEANDKVWQPDKPELGYGLVKMVEESMLGDDRLCEVAFEWYPGLVRVPEEGLVKVGRLDTESELEPEDWGTVEELRRRLGSALLYAENSQSSIFTRSFTLPLPHQAYVLEKILSNHRLGHVIADDVGMGKTIEAGLLIATYRQRMPRCKVLVLCPAGVVLQWQDEMEEHFGLTFDIAGRDFKPTREASWRTRQLVLASLDTLKQDHLREPLKAAESFDLVICDEAHRLTARRRFLDKSLYKTQNFRFVEWLVQSHLVTWEEKGDGSPRSPRLILMTGTPHQGDDIRFAYLLQLVRPDLINAENLSPKTIASWKGKEIEECITRTPKQDAVDWDGKRIFHGHDTNTLDVPLHITEKGVLDSLARFIQSIMVIKDSKAEEMLRALAMHTFQKIAASSWAALERALKMRLSSHCSDEDERKSMGMEIPFVGTQEEIEAIGELLELISIISHDSKWETFLELIDPGTGFRKPGEKILIFTQFRATQHYLTQKLEAMGETVFHIHGALSMEERMNQRAKFDGEGTILISTEAGSEGANLHKKCHLMVNYDIPWNPMRLLQRIGRLDRYGQTQRVKVANLKAPDSWDSIVSEKIHEKLEAVQEKMGMVADDNYRDMIIGGIHEAVNVSDIMQKTGWGMDDKSMNEEIEDVVKSVLARKDSIENVYRKTLGMPESFGLCAPDLGSDDFRQVFSWAAERHGISLKESRTSERRHLPGVYHFLLPEEFQGGFRVTRECHLVFDRDHFAEVRHTQLGRVRGQEIKPTLAGFGDGVTDWFVKSSLESTGQREVFQIPKPKGSPSDEKWWVAFAARWKVGDTWSGPDWVKVWGCDEFGNVIREVEPKAIMEAMAEEGSSRQSDGFGSLPSLKDCLNRTREDLKQLVDVSLHGKNLNVFPLAVVNLV